MCPRGNTYTKGKGVLVRNFEKNPEETQRSCVMGVAYLKLFSPIGGTNSKMTQ